MLKVPETQNKVPGPLLLEEFSGVLQYPCALLLFMCPLPWLAGDPGGAGPELS